MYLLIYYAKVKYFGCNCNLCTQNIHFYQPFGMSINRESDRMLFNFTCDVLTEQNMKDKTLLRKYISII